MSDTPKLRHRKDTPPLWVATEQDAFRHATPDELRAAVLPLIDYEAAAEAAAAAMYYWTVGDGAPTWDEVEGYLKSSWRETAKAAVDAALGLKETPALEYGQEGTLNP